MAAQPYLSFLIRNKIYQNNEWNKKGKQGTEDYAKSTLLFYPIWLNVYLDDESEKNFFYVDYKNEAFVWWEQFGMFVYLGLSFPSY